MYDRQKLFIAARAVSPQIGALWQNPQGAISEGDMLNELRDVYELERQLLEYKRLLHSVEFNNGG